MINKAQKGIWIAGLAVLAVVLVSVTAHAQQDPMTPQGKPQMMTMPLTKSAVDLRLAMRELWFEHLAYTHEYIVSALAKLPAASARAARLLRNQDDIGSAIKPIYGEAAGDKLTSLLKAHIMIATDVVKAAAAGNKDELATAQAKWTANAGDIAAFLSGANPHWSKAALVQMLQMHLDNTTEQAAAIIKMDWAGDIAALDKGYAQMEELADALAMGIVAQFPNKFKM